MDLMYLTDTISYQSRAFGWGHHDQQWVNINAKPDVKETRREKSACTTDQKNCSICKQKQKRALSNYIRKARKDSDKDVCIEEEEEEEEDDVKESAKKSASAGKEGKAEDKA